MYPFLCILLPEGKSLEDCVSEMTGFSEAQPRSRHQDVESISREKWAGLLLTKEIMPLYGQVNLALLTACSVQGLVLSAGGIKGTKTWPLTFRLNAIP